MVGDSQIQVWQDCTPANGYVMKICSRYLDDPRFTPEQEKAIFEIARSFLLVNRQTERRKRYAEKKKAERKRGEEHGHTMEEFMYGQDMGNPEDGSL